MKDTSNPIQIAQTDVGSGEEALGEDVLDNRVESDLSLSLPPNTLNRLTRNLLDALLSLQTVEEAARFLRDLCTRQEIRDLGQRWEVAQLLNQDLTYRQVAERTGVSTATITRINGWLQEGAGGYRLVLDRLGERT